MNYSIIIAEFNPLTNGHNYIIKKTKELFPNDGIIVIMSGNFVQRGEPAIIDKITRAEVAVSLGVDAVIELPLVFSLSSAEDFAFGAIKTASSIHSAKRIIMGSECGDINLLTQTANHLLNQKTSSKVKVALKQGVSVGTSIISSLEEPFKTIMSSPNNILAVEYLKAIKSQNSRLDAVTIKRVGGYNDLKLNNFASASAIREKIFAKNYSSLNGNLPELMLEKLKNSPTLNDSKLFSMIYYNLLSTPLSTLSNISGVSEGLEFGIKKHIICSSSLDELIENLSSKRYPKSKIRRILLNSLFNITKEVCLRAKTISLYLKVLAVGQNKNIVLKDLNSSSVSVLIKNKDQEKLSTEQKAILEIENFADKIYKFIVS